MEKMTLPKDVLFIMKKMKENGERCDVVGGSVRDFLLGREVNDFDLTTSAKPQKTKEIFKDFKTVDIGIKHGTVALIIDKNQYEITTYRVDGEYRDSRHPENVIFTENLKEDLARRDFTANAICYNDDSGFTDYYGGMKDIEDRVIRAVGEPVKRFREDALRILRAIRFSSVLNFRIEENTANSLHATAPLLNGVSKERIFVEWEKLVGGVNSYCVLEEYSDILKVIFPLLDSFKLPDKKRWNEADGFSRELSIFCLNSKNPALDFEKSRISLKTDKFSRNMGVKTLNSLTKNKLETKIDFLMLLKDVGERVAIETVKLGILLGSYPKETMKIFSDIICENPVYKISDLDIKGSDLEPLGFFGGEISVCLDALLDSVIFGKCKNCKKELLEFAKVIKSNCLKGKLNGI